MSRGRRSSGAFCHGSISSMCYLLFSLVKICSQASCPWHPWGHACSLTPGRTSTIFLISSFPSKMLEEAKQGSRDDEQHRLLRTACAQE